MALRRFPCVVSDGFSVSVVIPAYNEAARVGAAIESVRRQTEAAAEIIVVDDGSSDATAEIAAAAGARVVSKSNGGLSSARNRGIREASAAWVAFLDADDHWYPDKLAWLRRAHKLRPEAGLVFTDIEIIQEGVLAEPRLRAVPQYRSLPKELLDDSIVLIERAQLTQALVAGNFLSSSTLAVRRSLVLEHELFYDETLPATPAYHVSEDIEWYLRALKWTDAIVIERVLADYCRHEGTLSASAGRLKFGDVKLGERIAATPERYADGVAARFLRLRGYHLRSAAELYLRELDFRSARAMLGAAQREAFRLDVLALQAAAGALDNPPGRAASAFARRTWKRRLKPALQKLQRARP